MITRPHRSRQILLVWVTLIVIAMVSVGYAIANTPATSAEGRIVTLEKEVRCPSCGNLAVYNSKSASSYSIADYIQHEVHAGASNQEIVDSLVASYGDTILMAPPTNGVGLFLWLLPIVVGLVLVYEVYRSLSSRSRKERHRTRALAMVAPTAAVSVDVDAAELSTLIEDSIPPSVPPETGALEGVGDAREPNDAPSNRTTTVQGTEPVVEQPVRTAKGKSFFSRRLAQVGAALILVGVGALGTLLLTRSNSSSGPSLTQELASGEALAGLGAVQQARTEFDHVLATYPSDPTALAYVGWIDFNLAKTKSAKAEAIDVLSHAATLGAYDASAQLYYGLALYYGEDKPSAAVDHLDRFLATHPSKSLVEQAYRLAKPAYLAAHRKIPNTF
ncbi:cytochrome c-type biogenesis protein CcmH [Ferrimicrobium sp.]|uniref:cytochrome c-type biogenesis protein CcmH n=1 Tax=Ferrimicrobium sp. TaxID=2926050 RepID=UPI0026315DE5|nr:cytochrome c-type biogenesis protein CcmH [Ferrimicrobium sp.]